jgi:NTE family protein
MRKARLMIIGLMSIIPLLDSQKNGLVLSGGGAPGIVNIGIIKALEENNIPIDCLAGTSIGIIVRGMYSMGMTPDEMIHLLKSTDFIRYPESLKLKNSIFNDIQGFGKDSELFTFFFRHTI